MSYKDLNAAQRVTTVHFDFMKHPEFVRLGGVSQVGKVIIDPACPTAATNGVDVRYGEAFVMRLSRGQMRYLVAHENMHKALGHCTEYKEINAKYPRESNMAQDYSINQLIEEMDGGSGFVERPTDPAPLIDVKYAGMSFMQILQDLLKNPPPQGGEGKAGEGQGSGQPGGTMDEHIQSEPGEGEGQRSEEELAKVKQQIEDAVNQGEMASAKMRGETSGKGRRLSGEQVRHTDWRTPLRRFIQELCEGDEQSRFSPPNKRMLPLGIVLPSHFSEATGELIVACDTSGSMTGVYPTVFGEIARICQNAQPASVRVIWWDTRVHSVQVFAPKDYAAINKLLKPEGGGGTTVSVVADYIAKERLKPKAVIMLTDGYIESKYRVPTAPTLWGIVDNERFTPIKGKVVHINSMQG